MAVKDKNGRKYFACGAVKNMDLLKQYMKAANNFFNFKTLFRNGIKFFSCGAINNSSVLQKHMRVAGNFFKGKAAGLFKMLTSFFTKGR